MARPKSEFLSSLGIAFEVFKRIADSVIARGGSDEDIRRIIPDRKLSDQIAELIVGNRATFECRVWKHITLGTYKNADDYRRALKNDDFRIGDWANDILGKPEFVGSPEPQELDLVLLTVAELGFPDGAKREQIYAAAKSRDLELCPAEVGPALRLQYTDQPLGEWLLVGMEPIRDSGGFLDVFCVEHGARGQWLDTSWDYPDDVWDPDSRWLFRRK